MNRKESGIREQFWKLYSVFSSTELACWPSAGGVEFRFEPVGVLTLLGRLTVEDSLALEEQTKKYCPRDAIYITSS